MSLKTKLMEDLKQAVRQGDERRKAAIRLVKAAIINAEIEKRGQELSDEEILTIIAREVKRRREAIEKFTQGGREDLANQERAELDILLEYLPRQMSREEIEAAARKVIEEVGATSLADMGKVMGQLMPQLKGRADGKLVSQVVKEILAGGSG